MSFSFYHLLLSMSFSKLSFALYTMTLTIVVYTQTNSAAAASAITLTTTIAHIISGIVLPGLTKTHSSKRILYFTQVFQLVLFLLLFFLFLFEMSAFMIIVIFICNFMISLLQAAINPIKNAIVPTLVTDDQLVKANTLISSSEQSLLLIGWSLGGILISWTGNRFILFISFILLLFSLVSLSYVKIPKLQSKKAGKNFSTFFKTWQDIFIHPKLKTITWMDIISGFGGTVWIGAVTLAFVTEIYKKNEVWWGYINSAYFLGTILGGVFIWKFALKIQKNYIFYILTSTAVIAVLTILYGLNPYPIIGVLIVIALGPFYQLSGITKRSYIQQEIPKEDLPAIFASKATLNQIVFSISLVIVGLMIDISSARFTYFFAGIVLCLSVLYGYFSFRRNLSKNQNIDFYP